MYLLVFGFFCSNLWLFLHLAVPHLVLLLDSVPFCVLDMMCLSILLLLDIQAVSTSRLKLDS